MIAILPFVTILFGATALAAPLDPRASTQTQTVTTAQFSSGFLKAAQLSRLAYCPSNTITKLQCGKPCDELKGLQILQTGGDGGKIPLFFIASDPATKTIIAAHQGTDSKEILSIVNDAKFGLIPINTKFFPKAPKGVLVHDGFQDAFERSADTILAGVKSAMASTGFKSVLATGHSLGAALATMDCLMFKMNLPADTDLTCKTFGTPRGGNQEFADLIDTTIGAKYQFVTNQADPVPSVPPKFLGFRHSSGEFHIQAVNAFGNPSRSVACVGQDNESCSTGNSILKASVSNHKGPYVGNVSMSHSNCPGF